MKNNKQKQSGAAAIEYAILAAAMSLIMLQFLGSNGDLTQAIEGTYQSVIDKLQTIQDSK